MFYGLDVEYNDDLPVVIESETNDGVSLNSFLSIIVRWFWDFLG